MAGAGQAEASSSYASTSTARSSTYDIFLNFRGVDTRKGFTGHLYNALKRERINVFMDSHELREGEEIGPKLMEAIQGSEISIPIFSKGYADSKWCLMELEKILECHKSNGQIVLPIFLDVEPSEVRHQSGRSFKKAFLKHERNFQSQRVKRWREALSEIGKMKGWVLNQIDNGNESTLNQCVVERILEETSSNYLSDVKHPVGLDSRLNDIGSLLNIGSKDVQFVGICGEGGIGKTTIAKAVYNNFIKSFRHNCFLENIKEEASGGSKGLVSLQKKLIYGITKRKVAGEISLVDGGKEEIRNRCQGVNVLLVLDDVDHHSQLDALAIDLKWLGQGSRVIITTRDEHVLNVANVDPNNIYWPKELDPDQSLRLFILHAFKQDEPFEDYKELSRDVACYSGGLPLTLKVLGSYLSDVRDKEVWKSAFEKLRESPKKEVYEKLKISYDNLEDDDQRAIFLDAACFFIGRQKEYVISVWEACGYHPNLAIKRLIQRSLLKFTIKANSTLYLEMHDQIRDMGRQIVLEESCGMLEKRSRLWTKKEIVEVLQGHKGTEYIKGIHLHGQWIDHQFPSNCLPIECLEKMSNLRFLDIKNANFEGDDFPHLPCELRWFNWTGCQIKVLPDNFHHKRLVHLDLSLSNIELAWHIRPQNGYKFQNLKVLRLACCPTSICPDFSWFPSLEQLDLSGGRKLFNIDESIGQLSHLKSLDLHDSSLKKLPESIGDLKSLLKLNLVGTNVEELPDSICRLSSLQRLDLTWCESLNRLPESIGDLKSLVMLKLKEAMMINELPDSICRLSSLQRLYLNWCQSLNRLPESIGDLKSLLKLNLAGTNVEELPDSICRLSSLQRLDLTWCRSLNRLPESIGDLKSLVMLKLDNTRIGELPESVGLLEKLEILRVQYYRNPMKLPRSNGRMGCLRTVQMEGTGISTLEALPADLSGLKNLRELVLSNLEKLRYLLELPSSLISLECHGCTSLERLPDLSRLKSLRKLFLTECYKLEKIRGLRGLDSLKDFFMIARHYNKVSQGRPFLRYFPGYGVLQSSFHLPSKEYSFLKANDWIHKQLFLIIAFAFHSDLKEYLEEGELVDIELIVSIDFSNGYGESLECCHSIFIKNVEFTTERDIIYVHQLEGFTWCGRPLGGKDVMREIHVDMSSLIKLSDSGVYHRIGEFLSNCVELKSWSLEYVYNNFNNKLGIREYGDKGTRIGDVLSGPWPHHDADADAGARPGKGIILQSAFTEEEGDFRTEYIVSNYGNGRPYLCDTKERIYFLLVGPYKEDDNTIAEKDPPLCSRKKRTSVTSRAIGSVGPGDDTADVAEETPEASSTNRRSTRKKRRPSTLSDYV